MVVEKEAKPFGPKDLYKAILRYHDAVSRAVEYGLITAGDPLELEGLRQRFSISDKEHQALLSQMEKEDINYQLHAYEQVLETALADDKITEDEEAMLQSLRSTFDITPAKHQEMEKRIIAGKENPGEVAYRKALAIVYEDGQLSKEGEEFLATQREKHGISQDIHDRLVAEYTTAASTPAPKVPEGTKVLKPKLIKKHVLKPKKAPVGLEKMEEGKCPPQDPHPTQGPSSEPQMQAEEASTDASGMSANDWISKGEDLWCNMESDDSVDLVDVMNCFDKAIDLEPLNGLAWSNKGFVLKNMGKSDLAIKCYDRAIRIDASNSVSWFNKGVLMGATGKYEEAMGCFDRVLELEPDHQGASENKELLKKLMSKNKIKSAGQ